MPNFGNSGTRARAMNAKSSDAKKTNNGFGGIKPFMLTGAGKPSRKCTCRDGSKNIIYN